MTLQLFNIINSLFWGTILILIALAQKSFTTFEFLVLILIGMLGFTIAMDRPWYGKEKRK